MKIINATAPCRINDIGGWTDTRFAKYGAVCSVAVYPGAHVQVFKTSAGGIEVRLENYELAYSAGKQLELDHPFIAEAINRTAFEGDNMRIHIHSVMPPGASTGTSAAVIVALLGALAEAMGNPYTTRGAMVMAHQIETELGFESGIQDQVAAAFGGVGFIEIRDYPQYVHTDVALTDSIRFQLEQRLMLVYIGKPHASSEIHKRVIASLGDEPEDNEYIESLRCAAHVARNALHRGDFKTYGGVMMSNTMAQEMLDADLVCPKAREVSDIASSYDALGWKVNGAGGDGGTVTILTDGDGSKWRRLERELHEHWFEVIPISIAREGLRVWRSV